MTRPLFCRYQCPECAGKFRWAFGDDPPLFCPLCSAYVGEDESEEFVPKAPLPRKAGNEVPEKVYRAMEEGSINRANMAYEVGGGDRSDYNNMHITDLKDKCYEGEPAAVTPPPNPVQRFMSQNPQVGGMAHASSQIGTNGQLTPQGAAAMAHVGPFPHAGAGMAGRVQDVHSKVLNTIRNEYRINK